MGAKFSKGDDKPDRANLKTQYASQKTAEHKNLAGTGVAADGAPEKRVSLTQADGKSLYKSERKAVHGGLAAAILNKK
jgi:hypothetical protein